MGKEQEVVAKLLEGWHTMKKREGYQAQYASLIILTEKVKNFIKVVLKDTMRMREIDLIFQNPPPSPQSGLTIYNDDWNRLKNCQGFLFTIIKSIENELNLRENFKEETEKIDKLDTKIKDAQKEAERRAHVVDSKILGAIIEFLDLQRNELKKRDEQTKALNEINSKLDLLLEKKKQEAKSE